MLGQLAGPAVSARVGYSKWPPADADEALAMYAAGKTLAEIMARFKRSEMSVRCFLQARTGGSKGAVAKRRPCMCCQKLFFSWGPGNRMCAKCRSIGSSVSPYAL